MQVASSYLTFGNYIFVATSLKASNCLASNNDLVKQSTRLKLGQCAFSIVGPCVWNQLPTDIKTITDTRVFLGANLNHFYFRQHTVVSGLDVLSHRLIM